MPVLTSERDTGHRDSLTGLPKERGLRLLRRPVTQARRHQQGQPTADTRPEARALLGRPERRPVNGQGLEAAAA